MNAIETFIFTERQPGRFKCPACSEDRRKHNPTLQVSEKPDCWVYLCHHCGSKGRVAYRSNNFMPTQKPTLKPVPSTKIENNTNIIHNFFSQRGISLSGIDLNGSIVTGQKYFPQLGEKLDAIGFVYKTQSDEMAIKWRPASEKKSFTQDSAARTLYGLRRLTKNQDRIILVEGEADVVALASIGIDAWSVPNGAPMKVSRGRIDPREDTKFAYVWDAWDEIESAGKVILATDSDAPGQALKQELSRRIGIEKCWEVNLPDDCKDVTDVIKALGPDIANKMFDSAKPMPLQGVYDVESYSETLMSLYEDGLDSGESTGLSGVDNLFKVKEGNVYIVTGYPGHGKSEFIDQVMFNLAKNNSWKWAVASFENQPAQHISKLVEKYTGKNFYSGKNERANKEEVKEAVQFLQDHFVFLEQKDGSMPTLEGLMSRIRLAIARCGCRGAIIDPYNYIDMSHNESEHVGISVMLSELSSFAKANGIALFFVAHPQKLLPSPDGTMPVPKGSHISGSAAWWAKADIGLTVQRTETDVEIHCWKSRFKWLGQVGVAKVYYDKVSGRYSDFSPTSEWVRLDKEGNLKSEDDSNKYDDLPF